ncbi:MAG TPA: hypothetical protein VLF71_02130 [Candidatus Saccharimonadales bacterium]|nr:hypothetical protein [Candidatus Saccharimonadales bacterium]
MKKNMLVVGGAAVVVVAVVIGAVVMHKGPGSGGSSGGSGNTAGAAAQAGTPAGGSYTVVSACKALTLADATAVLGKGTKAGSANGSSDTASGDVSVSTCSYSGAAGLTIEDTKTVTLLSRSAKTKAGADSNESIFTTSKPTGKQDVPGVGDAAFWDAQLSQLDVLQHHNWYIIGNMSGAHADSGTLDVSKAVYSQIKAKL